MNHRITVCKSCRNKEIDHGRQATLLVSDVMPERSARKAIYLFEDINPDMDIDDLEQFARQYAYLQDGWCSSIDHRPGKLRHSTLARVPVAVMAVDDTKVRAS